MKFNQNNKFGENRVIFSVDGNFIDQSNKIQKFVTDKDRQARIANWLALGSLITAVIIAIVK